MIYIQNTLGGDVAAFDETDGDREVARFSPGDKLHPDSIVLSADGSTLHMNASNRFELWDEPEALARSKFYGLDAKTLELKWSVDLPGQIEHFAASPDKRYVYNAHYDRKVVSEVDTQTRSVKLIKVTDMGGHKVRCTEDGKKVYVGSMIWASLDEIDRETGAFTRRMTFDDNVRPFALSKDGERAYVQLNRMHGFHVVELENLKIIDTVKGPGLRGAYPGHEAHYPFTCDHGIEITPDEKFLITLATTGDFICVYNYPSLKLVTTIETDTQPSYLTVSKDSRWCYVSCRVSGTVHVYDLKSLKLNRTLKDVGVFPQRVCVDH